MNTVRWSTLEAALPLNELPAFHRAFLKLHRPELAAETLPLRRVQQYVHQTLLLLVKEGRAKAVQGDFELVPDCIPPPYRP
ncbi:hypothetical protein [Meiothermus taiwanensis]|jgi:hypothetical protein|uniref:Uncharacterized protein n=1 Tax=Meiothermus taiwanensis WR-220 TaxID=1339250 RepID=A0ABN5LVT6_9DEIN|nr:hypothetical protein [Meiothermus taiwanensis]AWR85709.1 hypothetical protein Mtai_v1c04610 [Meiothermus taiwanensis WR-220]KIQ55531.1 hypothetical protein SY28_02905 [Meiothermus taiwanensis]KZK15926.1 hypothetical protein A3962_08115 [Meiothermus taiwanensis]